MLTAPGAPDLRRRRRQRQLRRKWPLCTPLRELLRGWRQPPPAAPRTFVLPHISQPGYGATQGAGGPGSPRGKESLFLTRRVPEKGPGRAGHPASSLRCAPRGAPAHLWALSGPPWGQASPLLLRVVTGPLTPQGSPGGRRCCARSHEMCFATVCAPVVQRAMTFLGCRRLAGAGRPAHPPVFGEHAPRGNLARRHFGSGSPVGRALRSPLCGGDPAPAPRQGCG